ncbi:erythromycin esterase family protein [Nocardia sp. NPDC004068]|uniref:erythromycin esterase family protein n=1 Tax=Nocardia sp. NPDC004068 TaxID=3364303 RepID=UPI0036CF440E
MTTFSTAVGSWVEREAHPLRTLDPAAALTDLEPFGEMVGEASVVALGAATRDTRELSAVAHRLVRYLVERKGFRAVVFEGDDAVSAAADAYVRDGSGDPRALLAHARSFWRTEELLEVLVRLRDHNRRHPADPVRIAHPEPDRYVGPGTGGLEEIERMLADNVIRWHENTGDKIVYWGGTAHTAAAAARTVRFAGRWVTHRNAGGYLRRHFGPGYLSVGLTFDHGTSMAYEFPSPPADFAEAALGGADAFLLDLRAAGDDVRPWLDRPAKTRLIGPEYDPADDAAYHLSGGTVAEWFDVVVHNQLVTPARLLGS